MKKTPVIIRVDGVCFHSWTRKNNCKVPFDYTLRYAFIESILTNIHKIHGFKIAYHQSDEISILLTDTNNINTEAWFNNNIQKLASVTASMITSEFNETVKSLGHTWYPAIFDARVFNIPENEIVNYFLWRAKDCYRNSVSSLAQNIFNHKELQGKKLHQLIKLLGNNYEDLDKVFKYGTFVTAKGTQVAVQPFYKKISEFYEAALIEKEI